MNDQGRKKFPIKATLIALTVCIVVIILVLMAVYWKFKSRHYPHFGPPTVATMMVDKTSYQPHVKTIGTLVAVHGVVLKSPVEGLVTAVHFDSNDKVAKGQPLVDVDPANLKAQLASAKADLVLNHVNYQRDLKLLATHAITQVAFDTSQANLAKAKAAVDAIQASLHDAMMTAPFSGQTSIRMVQLGDYVNKGEVITSLETLSPLWLDFSVPTRYLGQLKIGETVDLTSSAYPKTQFEGRVSAIAKLVSTDSDSVSLRAVVANKTHQLLPGQVVDVTLHLGEPVAAVAIPPTAIVYDKDGSFVYRIEDGKAVKTAVDIGAQINQLVAINHGIKVKDEIISAGVNKVTRDGEIVKAVRQKEGKKDQSTNRSGKKDKLNNIKSIN